MSQEDDRCHACKRGRLVRRKQRLSFNQLTDRGYVSCSAEIPALVCERCGSKIWDDIAEQIIEAAVRREYDKLRSKSTPTRPKED